MPDNKIVSLARVPQKFLDQVSRKFWEWQLGGKTPPEKRPYYEEHEIKNVPHRDMDVLLLPIRKAHVSQSGFFRVWRDKQGAKGINFAQNLKDFEDGNVIYVQAWLEEEPVDIGMIKAAISQFTHAYEKGKRDAGTLYETEPGADYRHVAIEYARDGAEIKAYLNEPDADNLTNRHGKKWWHRILRKYIDHGVSLFEIAKASNSDPSLNPATIFADPRSTEHLTIAHFRSTASLWMQKINPISKKDQKLDPNYHRLVSMLWFARALYTRGVKRSYETAETVERHTRLSRRSMNYIRTVLTPINLLAGPLFAPFIIAYIAFQGLSLLTAIGRSAAIKFFWKKIHTNHSLKNLLSKELNIISPFKPILRPWREGVFQERQAEYLSTHSFDDQAVDFFNMAKDEMTERQAVFRVDSNRTIASTQLLHVKTLGIATQDNRLAESIVRPDGIRIINVWKKNLVYVVADPAAPDHYAYPGSVISCRPTEEFKKEVIDAGKVLEINYGDPEQPINIITKEAAAKRLKELGIKDAEGCLYIQPLPAATLALCACIHPPNAIILPELLPLESKAWAAATKVGPAATAFWTRTRGSITSRIKGPERNAPPQKEKQPPAPIDPT